MNIKLHIEELILHGFAVGNRYRISTAIEQELTRLFIEQGVPQSLAQGGEVANLDGDAFEMAPDLKSEVIGAQIAQTVYRRLL